MWFVAQLAEHLTVNEAVVGSSPIDPPILISGPWQKGLCTSLSTKTMTVRVRSVPPFSFGRLAETDQRRFEEPKSLVRYQERPPTSQNRLRERMASSKKEKTAMFVFKSTKPIAT